MPKSARHTPKKSGMKSVAKPARRARPADSAPDGPVEDADVEALRPVPAKPAALRRVYVSFSAEINPNTSEALIELLAREANDGAQEIYLMFSTSGGGVMNGLNLYNVLRALPVNLIIHNVGNVDSIGNAIFLAGAERYACPHSTFMFHGLRFDTNSATKLEEKSLRERLNAVLANQGRIGRIMAERTTLSGAQIRGLFKEAKTKNAEFARTYGIIDDIRDVAIAPGVPIRTLAFKR
jgi:ATP-dependent protease ClpP protease subunit